jgi:hypothetical protein
MLEALKQVPAGKEVYERIVHGLKKDNTKQEDSPKNTNNKAKKSNVMSNKKVTTDTASQDAMVISEDIQKQGNTA